MAIKPFVSRPIAIDPYAIPKLEKERADDEPVYTANYTTTAPNVHLSYYAATPVASRSQLGSRVAAGVGAYWRFIGGAGG